MPASIDARRSTRGRAVRTWTRTRRVLALSLSLAGCRDVLGIQPAQRDPTAVECDAAACGDASVGQGQGQDEGKPSEERRPPSVHADAGPDAGDNGHSNVNMDAGADSGANDPGDAGAGSGAVTRPDAGPGGAANGSAESGGKGEDHGDPPQSVDGGSPGTPDDPCATNNGGCGDVRYWSCFHEPGAAPRCDDVDECATDNGGCGDPSFFACTNNAGAPAGCADIDECQINNGACGDARLVKCTNRRGAAPVCEDIDECANNNGGCGSTERVRCVNREAQPPSCVDVDECATDNGGCGDPVYYLCTNHENAEPTCGDIDECQTNNGGCSEFPQAICTNQAGGPATCVCPFGGPGDGYTCTRYTWTETSVTDYSTGLMWLRNVDSQTYNQMDANYYCARISGSGWRLPTKDELISLQDTQYRPTIDPTAFPNTPSGTYWSSSESASGPGWYVYVNFATGGWGAGKDDGDMQLYVRCVRTLSCFGNTCM